MKCSRCHRTALWHVNQRGYCREHHAEAQRLQAAVIQAREQGASEYESQQAGIERAMRINAARFRPNRRMA